MRLGIVTDLIARARMELEGPSIFEHGMEFTGKAQQDVALCAPMVGDVSGRVLNHPHADVAELFRPRARNAAFALVLDLRNQGPVRETKWNIGDGHGTTSLARLAHREADDHEGRKDGCRPPA